MLTPEAFAARAAAAAAAAVTAAAATPAAAAAESAKRARCDSSKPPFKTSDRDAKERIRELAQVHSPDKILRFMREAQTFVYAYKPHIGIEGEHIGVMAQVRTIAR